ncbi:DUF3857 domain-containing protein [Tenacibaculum soleae]|uniref:DUF3857 domain-containing protein n=1 Tax=Tenacibaculum soleae TaxID=447689 RepID=UPI0026E3770B|nr:DUF3857 domain-containing protein [Tenacibaculum soleae]MDO6813570.1 DUF3857 domain-containing protein [Tenacibaculum soleae]
MNRISKAIFLMAILLCVKTIAQAQEANILSSLTIPEILKTDANAVIRLQKTTITVTSPTQLIVKEKRIVTVLNKLGKTHVDAYKHYDEDTKITKLSAIIYDALGKKKKKYSKGDFTDVSAVDGGTLYSDSRVKVLEYTPTSYPYTIVIESEYKNSSTGFIPKWFPVENYYLSVEKSIYELHNPQNISFRKKEKNFKGFAIEKSSNENSLSYSLTNQKAIKYERGTVNYEDFVPNISISLNEFSLKGVQGKASNWKEFGKWRYNHLKNGNDVISETIKSNIKKLTSGVKSPLEKAKIVYKYVQDKTRYISVQEDIGGWRPITANKVDELGYGDCKGLTNYTKALLDAAGVTSHYSVVWAGSKKKNVHTYFSSMQGNHVILNIPNNGNDVWLECTSQTIPFGFLGDFTDDRDVLVITPEGGIIKRTTSYINDKNLQLNNAIITLLTNGDMSATIEKKSYGTQYGDRYHIKNYTKKELNKYYKSRVWDYNNNLEIENVVLENNKEKVEFTEKINANIKNFATVKDNSYLFKLNVFNRITSIPKRYRNRKRVLEIDRGFTDKDSFTFKIPEGYSILNLPLNKHISNKFGTYKIAFEKINETSFKYNREFSLKKGIHPKEEYKAYRKFRKTVAKYDNLRTELTKQ